MNLGGKKTLTHLQSPLHMSVSKENKDIKMMTEEVGGLPGKMTDLWLREWAEVQMLLLG